MGKFTPTYIKNSVYDIEEKFFENEKIRCVLLDIDNTLVADNHPDPDEKVFRFIEMLKKNEIKVCLISNNKKERVDSFNVNLKLKNVYRAHKPFVRKMLCAIDEMSCSREETLFIGDQLLTDILAGNRAGIRTMLVNPINISKENTFFKLKRFIEKRILMREFE